MERLEGPSFQYPTISSGGGCGGEGGGRRKGAFRDPPPCFSILLAPSPLTTIPVVSPPFPAIAQEEEDDAPATKGVSRRGTPAIATMR